MLTLGERMIYLDGGMGTLLQAMGLGGGERPEDWNIEHPERVKDIHRRYLRAGCDVVTTNTFGATEPQLGPRWESRLRAGVRIALEAIREEGHGWAALDMSSLGQLLAPYGQLCVEDAITAFRNAAEAGLEEGADLILIETMTDLMEIKAAMLGAKEAMERLQRKVPLWVSMSPQLEGRLLTGSDIEGAAAMIAALGADVIGLNCVGAPKDVMRNARELLLVSPVPVLISPNASLPVVKEGKTVFPTTPEEFALDMKEIAQDGAWVLGGCCGTTPEHIRALVEGTRSMAPAIRRPVETCVVSGRSAHVNLNAAPVMIGERLNPTGKPRMKQALRDGDLELLQREAAAQAEAGATVLDVNVGLPEIDEAAILPKVMESVQGVFAGPLQLDTASAKAMEAALRAYAGRPLMNSVSGKQTVMDELFPLCKRYGGVLVALLLDENGIPETAEGRIQIAKKIIAEAETHGVSKNDLLFDGLTLTVSAAPDSARVTLETVRRLRDELGVKTVLGVSNVSFGLPQRPVLTAAFVAMALENGLSAAIMNPLDEKVKSAFDASMALLGWDTGFEGYLARYAGTPAATTAREQETLTLPDAIVKGLTKGARMAAEAMLDAGASPLCVVEEGVMPPLKKVGDGYEKGKLFLPQLLQSANAAQAAFEVIRARMPAREGEQGDPVVLATVRGDVHDIGKNIVKVLLQNYGFQVIDLGRDVPPERVVEAARQSGAKVVGLSALMTTTVPAMEETVAMLKRELPSVQTVVGGAVLTEEYAQKLGADGYGRDAMATVRFAKKVYGGEKNNE